MKLKPKLLPCPFCGTQPTMEPWHGGGPKKRMISCANETCRVSPMTTGSTPSLAARAWNHREPSAGEQHGDL